MNNKNTVESIQEDAKRMVALLGQNNFTFQQVSTCMPLIYLQSILAAPVKNLEMADVGLKYFAAFVLESLKEEGWK